MKVEQYTSDITFRPGRYYVGDPAYGLGNAWNAAEDIFKSFESHGTARIQNHVVFGGRTPLGPGVYYDQRKRKYPCDTGLMSLIPLALVTANDISLGDIMMSQKLGHHVWFGNYFRIRYESGVFRFGQYVILDTSHDEAELEYS